MMFIKNAPNSHGYVNPCDVEDIWRDHLDYSYRECDGLLFPITTHPDGLGRPHVLLMYDRYAVILTSYRVGKNSTSS